MRNLIVLLLLAFVCIATASNLRTSLNTFTRQAGQPCEEVPDCDCNWEDPSKDCEHWGCTYFISVWQCCLYCGNGSF